MQCKQEHFLNHFFTYAWNWLLSVMVKACDWSWLNYTNIWCFDYWLVHTSFSKLKSWFTLYLSKLSHNQKTQPCLTSACDGLPYLTLNFEVWNPQYNSTIKNLPSNNFAKKLKNKSKAYKSYLQLLCQVYSHFVCIWVLFDDWYIQWNRICLRAKFHPYFSKMLNANQIKKMKISIFKKEQ